MSALKAHLDTLIDNELRARVNNPTVAALSTEDLRKAPVGNSLGLYIHRISVDPFGRNRRLEARTASRPPQRELAVNLHLLLIGWSASRVGEQVMLAWGMQALGGGLELDASLMAQEDPGWSEHDQVHVIPDDMSTEDLLRIWDGLPRDYILSSPYLVKTLRLGPLREIETAPDATSTVFPIGAGA